MLLPRISLANYQKWVEMGKSLGFVGTELVKFVTKSQADECEEQTAGRDERTLERNRDHERHEQNEREHEAREHELKKRESAKGAKRLKRLKSTSSQLSAVRAKRLRGQGDVA